MARAPRRDDDGFTVLEVVVAMSVFTVVLTSALAVLLGTMHLRADNGRRSVAADLAAQQLEAARALRAVDIPDGSATTTRAVGGTTYSITQTATYTTSSASSSACSATGSSLAYKLVTVTVTWPDMGSVHPVRTDTLRALGLGADGLDDTRGAAAITVQDATGSPVAGVPVVLTPGGATQTTGADGCAVFTSLSAGAYTATTDVVGRVGPSGAQRSTVTPIPVAASDIQRAVLVDAPSKQVAGAPDLPDGYSPGQIATPLSVSIRSTPTGTLVLGPCGSPTTTCLDTGGSPAVRNVFPATYDVWAGTCSDAAPQPGHVVVRPDLSTSSVSVALAGVEVKPTSASGTSVVGRTAYAVHAPDSATGTSGSCPGGVRLTLGAVGSAGLRASLPFGAWTITTDPASTAATDPLVTLTPSARTAPAVVAP